MTGLGGISVLEAARRAPAQPRRRAARGRVALPGRAWVVLWVLVLLWTSISFVPAGHPVVNADGLPLFGRFWAAALHPDLSVGYLTTTAEAALTTVSFAVLGTALSVLGGAGLALFLSELWWSPASRTRGGRARSAAGLILSRTAFGLPRGVHEAVWGLLLVAVLGRDPLVGVLAIAIPFGAITAKVFAEILDEADHGPYTALRLAGSGRFAALAYGLLPTTASALTSYGFYRFECSIRSAVILGMIGAGGIGLQLSLSFQGLRYDELWTSLYVLIALSAVVDRWGAALRRGNYQQRWQRSALAAVVLVLASVGHLAPEVSRWFSRRTLDLMVGLVDDLTPLRLPAGGWPTLVAGSVETLQLSVLAATLASVLGVAAGFLGARGATTPSRRAVATLTRLLLLVTRAIPPPVWALLVLFVVLPGPLPGALALGIYTFGILGRLFAEVVENLDRLPRATLSELGAGPLASFAYATVPAAAGQFGSYSLYRWEVALRETVIVGMVGAGGLGRLLEQQRAAFNYPAMATTVLTLIALSLLVDALSVAIRRSLR